MEVCPVGKGSTRKRGGNELTVYTKMTRFSCGFSLMEPANMEDKLTSTHKRRAQGLEAYGQGHKTDTQSTETMGKFLKFLCEVPPSEVHPTSLILTIVQCPHRLFRIQRGQHQACGRWSLSSAHPLNPHVSLPILNRALRHLVELRPGVP
ncbi:hypothetical protein RvY_07794 [Ramazzottius varieornatus]|uniref:Uncharacterized protein n=1 Tax=Ramazzottius varieornatus TaxID=947166 RepID=A0A1D1V3G4_RAMVA|nr:hypothetical protein RvY_07794 [Ramazzottius varieornatus]